MGLELAPTEAHLWIVATRPGSSALSEPARLRAYESLLTEDERKKCARFRFEKDRLTCLVTRALVRTVLSRYADVAPERWRFIENAYGRPEVSEPEKERGLRFNLSHTNGLVVCLVARDREVGVDVEDRERHGDLLEVADRFFSPYEVDALRALPEGEQLERFFSYWTLKESYIKARGMGLSLPLSQFSFLLDREADGIGIRLDPSLEDAAERWQFTAMSHGRRHAIAAAVESWGKPLRVVVRETVPLD